MCLKLKDLNKPMKQINAFFLNIRTYLSSKQVNTVENNLLLVKRFRVSSLVGACQ